MFIFYVAQYSNYTGKNNFNFFLAKANKSILETFSQYAANLVETGLWRYIRHIKK